MQNSSFDNYHLSVGHVISEAFHELITHTPDEAAIIQSHRFLRSLTAKNKLSVALHECVEEPTLKSIEKLVDEFGTTGKSLAHHHKYAQAALGLLTLEKQAKKPVDGNKAEHDRQAMRDLRNRRYARILMALTFVPYFDESFQMTRLDGLAMKQLKQFFHCVQILGLDVKYRELAQKLAPRLVPTQCDIALHHILEHEYPKHLEVLIFPSASFSPELGRVLDPNAIPEQTHDHIDEARIDSQDEEEEETRMQESSGLMQLVNGAGQLRNI